MFHDALAGLGVSGVVAENSAPLPPMGVVYERYGHGAIALGDLNSDGFGDYAVSAPGRASPIGQTPVPGAVFVRSGRTSDILYTLGDGQLDFGISLARMGDLNGDGIEDFAVGSPKFDGSPNAVFDPAGRVWVYSGVNGAVLTTLNGGSEFGEFGVSISAVADLNQDGKLDLLVGAPGVTNSRGQAQLFSAVNSSLLWTFEGVQAGERFGAAVAASRTDAHAVVIGAPAYDGHGANSGAARVFAPHGELLYELHGNEAGEEFGASLTLLGAAGPFESVTPVLAVGAPGADGVVIAGSEGNSNSGWAMDRGAVETFAARTGEAHGRLGGQRAPGLRFGAIVENVGDIDGDGAEDLGVLAPGGGANGAAAFFRQGAQEMHSFASMWNSSVPSQIGLARLPGTPGRGLGAVGDINNDGFVDVLLGDGSANATIVGAYALGGPITIDGASDNLRHAWSDSGARQILISKGTIRTYARVPGLLQSAPGDMASQRSRIQGINNNGVIVFSNLTPGVPESASALMALRNGAGVPLADLVTAIEGVAVPDFGIMRLAAIGNGNHMLLIDTHVWILHDGVLTLTPLGNATDINAAGVAVGSFLITDETVLGTWSRDAGFTVIQGLATAEAINDQNVVAGVLIGTKGPGTPGDLATWSKGTITNLGQASASHDPTSSPEWVVRGIDVSGRVLADIRQTANELPAFYATYLYEPDRGFRELLDATHALTVSPDKFGVWNDGSAPNPPGFVLSNDGRILAYNATLTPVGDETPWVLRDDSPTASISAWGENFLAGVNVFGELILFRENAMGWRGERLSTRLVAAGNTNLVTFADPKSGGAAFLVLADTGRLDIYSLNGETTGGNDLRTTPQAPHATPIVDKLTTFINSAGVVHLVGMDESNNLVIYFQYGSDPTVAPSAWGYDNLTRTHLDARGDETPGIVSNLTAFATPWGTMHIAGLDAQGHVQIVWWGNDSPLWRVNDLTAGAMNTRDMQGSLSAFVTDWNTLHINGTDEQGRVVALWWAQEFGGRWRVDSLAPDNSAQLMPGTLTTYVTPWGGLNVVGREAVNGRITTYWWSPESNEWAVAVLRTPTGELAPRMAGPVNASAAAAGTLSIYARGLDGNAMRLFWNPGDGGVWTPQDLTLLVMADGTNG